MAELEGTGDPRLDNQTSPTNPQLNTGSDMLTASIEAAGAFNLFREKINLVVSELNQQTVVNDVAQLKQSTEVDGLLILGLRRDIQELQIKLGTFRPIQPLDGDIDRPPRSGDQE